MKKHYSFTRFSFATAFGGLLIAAMSSCGKKDANSPGVEFFPDMYRSPSLEYYSVHTVDGDTVYNAKHPVAGTVARGYVPYTYPNTPEGYEQAGLNLKSPLDMSKREMWEKDGEVLYGKFCVHCHGAAGEGDGKVGAKLPGPPPAYSSAAIKNLPEGKIFHSITYGKNSMGSHASQVTAEERWKLVAYVQKLQGPKTTGTDSTAVAVPVATTTTK
ncbi:MAG: cytochrome c [Bacteroidia bacterium]|jgi:cytochrome c553|nr:cytochrome c [Bacteroidia bacterium]